MTSGDGPRPIRIVHYVNQFFAGIGGEDRAGDGPVRIDGPVGPGRKLQSLLPDGHQIVTTITCGDDYAVGPDAAQEIFELVAKEGADLFVAGPAFTSGRYGIACARAVALAQENQLPSVVSIHPQNPGLAEAGLAAAVACGETARDMGPSLDRLAQAIRKLAEGKALEPSDGLIGRSARRNARLERNAAERAVDLVVRRLAGQPAQGEVVTPEFADVRPAPPIADAAGAVVALLSEGGLVPGTNPDRLVSARATKWFRYPMEGLDGFDPEAFISVHGGFDTSHANADPNRILPLDAARKMEQEGRIGRLFPEYFVTTGNGTSVADAARFGAEWAAELREAGVQAAILTST